MKNLNRAIYDKIILQAEEAKELGLTKLASSVLSVMTEQPRDEDVVVTYSVAELKEDVQTKLWKIALDFINYHDLQSVDIQRVDEAVIHLAKTVSTVIEKAIDSDFKIGPLEPKLPGESK